MPIRSMTYPLGQAVVPAMLVHRSRAVPAGARVLVQTGESVQAAKPVAVLSTGEPVLAGLTGRVQQVLPGQIVLEGVVRLLHGMLGLGGQFAGPLVLAPRPEESSFGLAARGAVLLVPGQLSPMHLQNALGTGARGIIGASMSARDLESFARVDLTALLDGIVPAPTLPFALVLLDGIGDHDMDARCASLLTSALGSTVLLSGVTRAQPLVRPEVLLAASDAVPSALPLPHAIDVGVRVHIHAGPNRGAWGEIVSLPAFPEMIENHLFERCAFVRLADGSVRRLPVNALDVF